MKNLTTRYLLIVTLLTTALATAEATEGNRNLKRAAITLDSLFAHYSVENSKLLRENYPFDRDYTATYLDNGGEGSQPNPYAFLWPFSGTFSAANALYEATGDRKYKTLLDDNILIGLEQYLDTRRRPTAYASYINSAPESDRFYDDNVWLGIDFTDLYETTKDKRYLDKAQMVWQFIESGTDNKLGGGIYWCEQSKKSKNTCSNAPGSVYALKLFMATGDSTYLAKGKALYEWTKLTLQDISDYLYFDNLGMDGKIGKAKYAYNSGQMIQAAVLLSKITGEKKYLKDAQRVASAAHDYFFIEAKNGAKIFKGGNIWFTAVMFRGFVELHGADGNRKYLDTFQKSLDYAWDYVRDSNGLFTSEWSGRSEKPTRWLLDQAAMVEMYARLGNIK